MDEAVESGDATARGAVANFVETVHDFGRLVAGEPAKASFSFRNDGDEPLIVSEVDTSCGCAIVESWTRRLEPGAGGQILVQFDSSRFDGPVQQFVSVFSNDARRPLAQLKLRANVWAPVAVEPRYVDFGSLATRDEPKAVVVSIRNREDIPIEMAKAVVAPGAPFEVSLREVEAGKEYELLVSTVPPLTYGVNEGRITLETSSPSMPEVSLLAHAVVDSPVSVNPSQIILPFGRLPPGHAEVVSVSGQPGRTLTLGDPAVDLAGVKAEVAAVEKGSRYEVVVQFASDFVFPGEGRPALRLTTNNEEMPAIEIPIVQTRPRSRPELPNRTSPEVSSDRSLEKDADEPFHVSSSAINFGVLEDRAEIRRETVRISHRGGGEVALSSPEMASKAFRATLETIVSGQEFRLNVETTPNLTVGPNEAFVRIPTTNPAMPVLSIKLEANLAGDVVCLPERLVLPRGPLQESLTRYVTLRANQEGTFVPEFPGKQFGGVTGSFEEVRPGKQFRLALTFPAGFQVPKAGPVALRVNTGEEGASIVIPVLRPEQLKSASPNSPAAP